MSTLVDNSVILHPVSTISFSFSLNAQSTPIVCGPRKVSRSEAKELWKSGVLVGMFNIPFTNEEVFESCKDFAIQDESVHKSLIQELHDLKAKNDQLREMNQQIIIKLKAAKEEISHLNQRLISKEELNQKQEMESMKKLDKSSRQITDLQKRLQQLHDKLADSQETFKKEFEKQENHFKTNLEQQLQQQQQRMTRERDEEREELLISYEKKLHEEKRTWIDDLSQRENKQLQSDLDRSKSLVKELILQNKELSERLKEVRQSRDDLMVKNEQFKNRFYVGNSPTAAQTDQLNKHLLMFYRGFDQFQQASLDEDEEIDHDKEEDYDEEQMREKIGKNLLDEDDDWEY